MLLLVSGATVDMRNHDSDHLGVLIDPSGGNRKNYLNMQRWRGMTWAADNGCFNGLDKPRFLRMLAWLRGIPGCTFVTAPDVVGCAWQTLIRFRMWQPVITYYDFPVAFVAQDGLELIADRIPWTQFSALFIGGSTEWKLGVHAARFIREAKQRGKWVHMGRVNSVTRLRYAQAIGCDSVDGTGYSIEPGKIAKHLATLKTRQFAMEGFLI